MNKIQKRGEKIRQFILKNVSEHSNDIATITASKFGITRQAVGKHIRKLTNEGALVSAGSTRNREYTLKIVTRKPFRYQITSGLEEDTVWREDIAPLFSNALNNVIDIWEYGFTEMFNNAIEHSDGTSIILQINQTAINTELYIRDDGIGIFNKIQRELNLTDPRHAVLELAKGKLTTDPEHHSGEGIFFTSQMFDYFAIFSAEVVFSHRIDDIGDWVFETEENFEGTSVCMTLKNHITRTPKKIFDKYTTKDTFGFSKTFVPVRMAQYGDDRLISRSQARRMLARIDRFKTVVFDFEGVEFIGQAFADEVFRVFANKHPEIKIIPLSYNAAVQDMIQHVLGESL